MTKMSNSKIRMQNQVQSPRSQLLNMFKRCSIILALVIMLGCTVTSAAPKEPADPPPDTNDQRVAASGDLDSIAESDIIVLNSGLRVPFGRSVALDRQRHLKIVVRPGDHCVVRVLDGGGANELLSRHPGRLTPPEFPCEFAASDQVRYTHFGSRSPPHHRVRLLMKYSSGDDAILVPFAMEVRVRFDQQQEVVTRNMPLSVDKVGGFSNAVDAKVLQFAYDRQEMVCRLAVLRGAGVGLPRYGELTEYDLDEDERGMVDCEAFARSNVRYHHLLVGSPNYDYVPLMVVLLVAGGDHEATNELDAGQQFVKQEYFQLTVRIREARENTPPRVGDGSLLLMDVNQFVTTPVTLDIVHAEDDETPAAELLFNVTASPSFGEGQLVSTDDGQSLPVTTFTQRDLEELKIAYKPPASDSDVRRIYTVSLEVSDAEGLTSSPFTLLITVNPMNSLAPVVTRNTGITLFEGQSRRLHSAKNLEISDEDNMDDVTVGVAHGLRHGQLLLIDAPVKQFSPADLDAGLIRYQHDGSDTTTDNIVLRMSDGQHAPVEFLFPVTIFPQDDQPPILTTNTGITLQKKLEAEITPFVLSASDVDSDDDAILFRLQPPGPLYGELILRRTAVQDDDLGNGDEWVSVADEGGATTYYERQVSEFTQQDINDGTLLYRHLGEHHSHTVLDAITFQLSDDSTPPNESKEKQFLVKILPLDDIPPEVRPGTTLRMTVDEFQLTEFTRQHLSYTDADSDDRLLRYTVTRPLVDLDANGASPRDAGKLVLSEDPETPVNSFTQAQIDHHKIAYRPPSIEMGLTPRVVQFEFQVEDGAGNTLYGQLFDVELQPINNKPPLVTNRGFRVLENGLARVDTSVLDVSDPDTDSYRILFRLLDPPRHGTLQLHGVALGAGDEFVRDDLASGLLMYVNGGDEKRSDKFIVEVSDGAHRVPVTVQVIIRPVDDEMPKLRANGVAGTLGLTLTCLESKSVTLDPDIFSASDPDTEDRSLMFILEMAPRYGELRINGKRSDRFSQEQLRKRIVRYVHTAGEIGRRKDVRDSFNLTLSDMSTEWSVDGNRVRQIQVNVSVEPVNNMAPEATLVAGAIFEADEAGVATIGVEHLRVADRDSDESALVCTVLVQPVQGYVENVAPLPGSERSRAGLPITAFAATDLRRRTINYVQSIHQGVEPREDAFVLQCSDGVNVSPRLTFPVRIRPTNDERPTVIAAGDFTVLEGMQLNLDQTVLSARDLDVPADRLTFHVIRKPRHGKIIVQSPDGATEIDSFTEDQIRMVGDGDGGGGLLDSLPVAYVHDDSETSEDEFELRLSDGHANHSSVHTVRVTVVATDDETPRLTINNGLELDVGDTRAITGKNLRAEDIDSDNDALTYVLRLAPRHGHLIKLIPPPNNPTADSVHGQALTSAGRLNLTRGDNFTQADVDHQLVLYVHDGHEGARDLIKFDVTDGVNPLIDRHFYVTVAGTDAIYPDVVSRGVELPEGGRVTLTTDTLSTSDIDSDNRLLTFTVTRAPARGQLESSDSPGTPIATFRQLDLAGNKISYVHTDGAESRMDSFEFEVSDGFNSVFRTFRISLSDVDNKRPVLFLGRLSVRENGYRVLTPFELKIEDRDTPDQALRVTVTQGPQHGSLVYNRTRLHVTQFSMADVEGHLIGYQHDGSETVADSFRFVVSDGAHKDFVVYPNTERATRRSQTLSVDVVAVDNGVPYLVTNRGASALTVLQSTVPEQHQQLAPSVYGFQLSSKSLKAQDRDSPSADLMFVVTSVPKHGRLVSRTKNNGTVANFTQGDIDEGHIIYILNPGENATGDVFEFKVVDKGNNELSNENFRLNWAWISLEYDSYTVNETETHLRINMRRRGYLGETSFIGVKTMDLSAKRGRDFHKSFAKQVQFNPGQSEAVWRLRMLDDDTFERHEMFQVILEEPVMATVEYPDMAAVTIVDDEDECVVSFVEAKFEVDENAGEFSIPVQRKGDLSEELVVTCSTESGSATGTIPQSLLSYSDFISRPVDLRHSVRFESQQSTAECRLIIIDDSMLEEAERFRVLLGTPTGGRLGSPNRTEVSIRSDPHDVPTFFFGEPAYTVDESDGFLEVVVWRSGTDLTRPATVTVQSRPSTPPSAEAGHDYMGVGSTLEFATGVAVSTIRITILDDLGLPRLEGLETFELVLRMPVNAVLGEPSTAIVAINDTLSDLPRMQFAEETYSVSENDGHLVAVVRRTGDLSRSSTVRCYTRQGTAKVQLDFEERPDTDNSLLKFAPDQAEARCEVSLVGDDVHEPEEEFRLVLGKPMSYSQTTAVSEEALLGVWNFTRITIRDTADRPVLRFEKTKYNVREPKLASKASTVEVAVVRQGDRSLTSVVRVHTKDGSAKSGEDYHGLSRELLFTPGVERMAVLLEIMFDTEREHRETFTLLLKPDKHQVADIKDAKATIYIQEDEVVADVTFPSPPLVVSLRDYDNAAVLSPPTPGYPLVCITACNPKHPDFAKTGTLCVKEGLNDSLTEFRWRVAPSSIEEGATREMRDMEVNTFFASTKQITLDSIFFSVGNRVQCGARVVSVSGDIGLESLSDAVTVAGDGLCTARIAGSFGAEPFAAKMRYVGPNNGDGHPNTVRLSVTLPHRDGMLPVVSTRSLSNFELTLSRDGARTADHRCSNLLDSDEIKTRWGFITSDTKNPDVIGEVEPYQYSTELRGESTLRFYRNLDIESCMWEFVSYFDMSELVSECGAIIVTDGVVLDAVQSHVSVRVQLHVSYVFLADGSRWQHNDLQTQLRLTFVYDTAILWKNGIAAADDSPLQAHLFPLSMRIRDDGRLVVRFRTEARFRGHLVTSHPGSSVTATVTSRSQPDLTFKLTQMRGDTNAGGQPRRQQWQFVSDYAVRDYSGAYHVKLLPCTMAIASTEAEPGSPLTCSPSREPINFELQIRFQQVSDPVAARYSLNTQFRLMKRRDLWLADGSNGFGEDTDASFQQGDKVYGRIMVDPLQSLGAAFRLRIDKCYLCTGIDGYVPKYSPADNEYGCMADSGSLLHVFKIIDRRAPTTVHTHFSGAPFNAVLAFEEEETQSTGATRLTEQSGSDGFRFDSAALFRGAPGRQWFVHCVYRLQSEQDGVNRRKRSAQNASNHRNRRTSDDDEDDVLELTGEIGSDGRGTNMHSIQLDGSRIDSGVVAAGGSDSPVTLMVTVLGAVLGALIVIVLVALLIAKRKRSRSGGQQSNADKRKFSPSVKEIECKIGDHRGRDLKNGCVKNGSAKNGCAKNGGSAKTGAIAEHPTTLVPTTVVIDSTPGGVTAVRVVPPPLIALPRYCKNRTRFPDKTEV